MSAETILITDYAWPDLEIERGVIEGAGLKMVSGPAQPSTADAIEQLVRTHRPASILTCWAPVSQGAIAASTELRHVGRIGVGLDNIDVAACSARKVLVTNVPDYCVEEVSDHALAFALAWTRGLVGLDRSVRSGRWDPAEAKLRRLSTLTVGIVGYGRIGQASARKFSALGCRVLVCRLGAGAGGNLRSLEELLAASDIVVLHVPLTDRTRGLINEDTIRLMKRGAFLINLSRGAVVDSEALAQALESGHLAGAGLDVLDTEPQVPAALLRQESAILTPHVAFSSDASLAELRRRAAEEAVRILSGLPSLHPCNLK